MTLQRVIENPDTGSPRREDREIETQGWNKQTGEKIANEQGISMTDEHWEVIECLREYYVENGPAGNGKELGDMLGNRFSERGGRRYLRQLFPNGPVGQGMRIAGLEVPPDTEDKGFGTSR